VDEALARLDIEGARRSWQGAHEEALRSRHWDGLVEVGHGALRIGTAAGSRRATEPEARRAYLAAMFRARQQGSVEGVLRAAEAFAALGDRQVAEHGLRMASRMASGGTDQPAPDQVRAIAVGWSMTSAPPQARFEAAEPAP
jgi:hypothetical protein